METLVNELNQLFNFIGLSSEWNSIVALLVIVLGFFVMRHLKRRSARNAKIGDELQEYSKIQGEELIEAYRMLYEGEIDDATEPSKFVEIVQDADKRIMRPYTKYKLLLDKPVRLKIIGIHNILEQFLHDPSQEAVIRFMALKEYFYKKVEEAGSMIEKKCLQK